MPFRAWGFKSPLRHTEKIQLTRAPALVNGFFGTRRKREMPRAYAPELRRRVIDLIEGGRSVAEVAAMVEPTEQTIYNRRNRHLVDTARRTPDRQSGLVSSMGSIGGCYDDVVVESFWGRVQTELLNRIHGSGWRRPQPTTPPQLHRDAPPRSSMR